MSILADFYNPEIIQDPKYKFSQSGVYYAPPKSIYEEYVEFIKVTNHFPKQSKVYFWVVISVFIRQPIRFFSNDGYDKIRCETV